MPDDAQRATREQPGAPEALRVLHVNDVGGVASTAVQQARREGLDWSLWPLPAVRGAPTPVKVARRLNDLARFHSAGRAADVLHIHYGLFGYYAWSVRRPYLLHLHGTDVRRNLSQRGLGRLVQAGVRRAGVVAYSTPDLADIVLGLRPDAVWLPAPVSADAVERHREQPTGDLRSFGIDGDAGGRPTVVFASRWDPVKGLDLLVETATRLRAEQPDVRLIGIDWGVGAARARAAGVDLIPMIPAPRFRDLLSAADVVIGQLASGCLGVSDLEAMVMQRPLVARFTAGAAYGDEPPIWNTAEVDAVDAVRAVLDDPSAARSRAAASAAWALRRHSPREFVSAAGDLYRRFRDSRGAEAR